MKKAFTLVELLVGISIIAVVFSIGVVSYREFSRRQELQGVLRSVTSDLRYAQQLALSGQKPDASLGTCSRLDGYSFVRNSSNSYQIVANCLEGNRIIKTVDLGNLTITSTYATLRFKILGLGTDLVDTNTITISSQTTGNVISISIGTGGDIK